MRRKSHRRSLKWLNTEDHCYFGFSGNVGLMEQSTDKGVNSGEFSSTPPLSPFHGFVSILLFFDWGGGRCCSFYKEYLYNRYFYRIGIQSMACYLKDGSTTLLLYILIFFPWFFGTRDAFLEMTCFMYI